MISGSAYKDLHKVEAKIDNNGESYNNSGNWHKLMIYKDSYNYIEMYTLKDTLNCNVVTNGISHHQMLPGTVVGDGRNDWRITWDSTTVSFYLNNYNKHNEYLDWYTPPAAGRFQVACRAKLQTGPYGSANTMEVDSVLGLSQDPSTPEVKIVSTWTQGSNPPTAYVRLSLDKEADVDIYLEKFCSTCTFPRQSLIYVTSLDSVSGGWIQTQASYTFSGGDSTGYYRWLVIADPVGSGTIDSVFGSGFYYNGSTALAAASEVIPTASSLPKAFSLAQNYPNPFNPSTTISYSIPEGQNPHVNLVIYNVRGQVVKTLVAGERRDPGSYYVYWDGKDRLGKPVASGIYFYRLQAGDFIATRKMVMLK